MAWSLRTPLAFKVCSRNVVISVGEKQATKFGMELIAPSFFPQQRVCMTEGVTRFTVNAENAYCQLKDDGDAC